MDFRFFCFADAILFIYVYIVFFCTGCFRLEAPCDVSVAAGGGLGLWRSRGGLLAVKKSVG